MNAPRFVFENYTPHYALALGTCVCAFEGAIGATMPMYESVSPHLRPRYLRIFGSTVVVVVLALTAFGVVCYLALTNETQSIVLLNLSVWQTPGSRACPELRRPAGRI